MFNIKLILILWSIPEIGRKTANGLIKGKLPKNLESYSIFDFLNENMYKFKKINSINMKSIYDAKVKCENILKKCEKEDIKIISILDDDFPEKLKNIKEGAAGHSAAPSFMIFLLPPNASHFGRGLP